MRIFDNFLYKIAAVVVAAVLWATAQGLKEGENSFDLQIDLVDVPAELVVVEQSAYEVNLRVEGSRAALSRAEKNLVRYPLSLSGAKPGEARFQITNDRVRNMLPRGAKIKHRSPTTLVLHLEPVVAKRVRVRADVAGELAVGLKLTGVRVDPPEVELAGAKTQMRRLDHVATERLDISGLSETTTLETTLILYSHVWRAAEDGQPVKVELEVESEEADRAEVRRGGTG
jgi:YbbR domain-containing protein